MSELFFCYFDGTSEALRFPINFNDPDKFEIT